MRPIRADVTTDPTAIAEIGATGNHPCEVVIKNDSEITVFIGDVSVSIETGFPIDPHQNISFTVRAPDSIYAVSPDDTVVYILVV